MALRSVALYCLDLAEDYLSTNQRSWEWLRSLNSGYTENYLNKVLLSRGLVKREESEQLKMLDRGRESLREEFPLIEWRKRRWDGIWRVVMYDISEKQRPKRDKLRRWLKMMGFGQWQISVWVSPFPLAEKTYQFLEKAGLDEECGVYESKRVSGISDIDFAGKVWGLDRLDEKYQRILDSFDVTKKSYYLEMLMRDPVLPEELLPSNWVGDKLIRRIMEK